MEGRAVSIGEQFTQWPMSDRVQAAEPETSSSPRWHNYDYAVDEFFALHAGDIDNPLPSRIKRVLMSHKNEGNITHQKVHWNERKRGSDIYEAAYRPLVITCSGAVRQNG